MNYLSERGIVHRDLAARKILRKYFLPMLPTIWSQRPVNHEAVLSDPRTLRNVWLIILERDTFFLKVVIGLSVNMRCDVLVKSLHQVKISDFGLARLLNITEDEHQAGGAKVCIHNSS